MLIDKDMTLVVEVGSAEVSPVRSDYLAAIVSRFFVRKEHAYDEYSQRQLIIPNCSALSRLRRAVARAARCRVRFTPTNIGQFT